MVQYPGLGKSEFPLISHAKVKPLNCSQDSHSLPPKMLVLICSWMASFWPAPPPPLPSGPDAGSLSCHTEPRSVLTFLGGLGK